MAKKATKKKNTKKNDTREKAKTVTIVVIFLGLLLTMAVLGIVLVNELQKKNVINSANRALVIEEYDESEEPEEPGDFYLPTEPDGGFDESEFEYEGWIDCMPPLDGERAELCRRAEAAGYEKIAY